MTPRARGTSDIDAGAHDGRARSSAALGALALVIAALAFSRLVSAQTSDAERRRAADAYDAGIQAYRAGDYARAGERFARANALDPSPIALAQAVRAYRQTNEIRIAGTLALRLLAQEGLAEVVREIAEGAIADARQWYVRVDVACSSPCTVTVDGSPEESTRFFAAPDRDLRIVARFRGGSTLEEVVRASAGEARLVSFDAPEGEWAGPTGGGNAEPIDPRALEAEALESSENPYRISRHRYFSRPRATFFAVIGPTAVGVGMLTWSALDTRNSRETLRELPADVSEADRARAETEHARNVRRTKWIAVEEAVFVTATVLIAALTDWTPYGDDADDDSRTSARIDVVPQGVTASLEHSF